MSPMLNSHYFQPMQHKPLPDIRKYALVSEHKDELYAIVKPVGLDVYVNSGHFYDTNQNRLNNKFLYFQFSKLLETTNNTKMTVQGTLVSSNALLLEQKKMLLYSQTNSIPFSDLTFVIYDSYFPVFNIDHVFRLRYDIAAKVVGHLSHCCIAPITKIKDQFALENFVKDMFLIDAGVSIILYRSEGLYSPGISQLLYENADVVSYIIEAKQLFRGHVKSILPSTVEYGNRDKFDAAIIIFSRFKREDIEVPIGYENIGLRKYIWDRRKELKGMPFWFTGHTFMDNSKPTLEYKTIINRFLSFLSTEGINEERL